MEASSKKSVFVDFFFFFSRRPPLDFNEKYGMFWDKLDAPLLKAFYAHMCERPNLKAYRASDRFVPFAGDSMM